MNYTMKNHIMHQIKIHDQLWLRQRYL